MAEVRKRDDRPPAHAQHLLQHLQRGARFLQRLAQDHVIERLVRIIREALIDIALIDRNAPRNRAAHLRRRNLHAAREHLLMFRQPGQQLAFAAAEIEHAAAGLDDLADDVKVRPLGERDGLRDASHG